MYLTDDELIIQQSAVPVEDRYCITDDKLKREVVLLKGRYCKWRKCTFCDYWADGSQDQQELDQVNYAELDKITGETGVLEVINSGSIFELPKRHIERIQQIIKDKNIHTFIYEAHYLYHKKVAQFNAQFEVERIIAKTGLETYHDDFRENYLKKGFANPLDQAYLHSLFNGVNLLVGVKGQSIEMIERDLRLATQHMDLIIVNIFTANVRDIEIDEALIEQFYQLLPKYDTPNLIVYDHKNAVGLG